MAKYLLLWEVDPTRTPEDPKERQQQWLAFQNTVVDQLKNAGLKDWGEYVGEINGYAIFEGTEVELAILTSLWVPFVKFKVRSVITIEQVIQATKAMTA